MRKQIAVAGFFMIVYLGLCIKAVAQDHTLPLGDVSNVWKLAGGVLGAGIILLQLYIANKQAKSEAKTFAAIDASEKRMIDRIDMKVEKLELKVEKEVGQLENKMAAKSDIQSLRELFSVSMENVRSQITAATRNIQNDNR